MNVNYWAIVTVMLGLCVSFSSFAGKDRVAERSTQYKCHLTMQDGTQLVNYRMSKPKNAKALAQRLNGHYIFAKNGVTKRGISTAHECVLASEQFRSEKAKALDAKALH